MTDNQESYDEWVESLSLGAPAPDDGEPNDAGQFIRKFLGDQNPETDFGIWAREIVGASGETNANTEPLDDRAVKGETNAANVFDYRDSLPDDLKGVYNDAMEKYNPLSVVFSRLDEGTRRGYVEMIRGKIRSEYGGQGDKFVESLMDVLGFSESKEE